MDKYLEGAIILAKLINVKGIILIPAKRCSFIDLLEPFAAMFGQDVDDGLRGLDILRDPEVSEAHIVTGGKVLLLEDFLK